MKISLRAIVGALLLAGVGSAYAANPLSVELRAQASKSSPGESVVWSLTNNSDEAIHVLRWETPLDGLSRSIFDVSKNGRPVRYMDKIVHWGHPEASDFVKIAPGQTISAEVNLAASYEMVAAGNYTVSFEGQLTYMIAADEKTGHVEDLGAAQLDADAVQMYSLGRSQSYYNGLGAVGQSLNFAKAAAYANCSSSQQTQFGSTHTNAKTYSANARSYLTAGTAGPRYTTWFGAYSSTRYATVKDHFTKIDNALGSATITYDCYCDPSAATAYAYVYANQPYIIHLCGAFWSAPATGTDSKAGTIIHEMSHFTVNGGTQDYAYGQTKAKQLASTNPKRAIQNADNHEYFAENTPAQN